MLHLLTAHPTIQTGPPATIALSSVPEPKPAEHNDPAELQDIRESIDLIPRAVR